MKMVFLFWLLTTTVVFAQQPGFMPPAQYDHPARNMVVKWLPWPEVAHICHGHVACAITGGGRCVVIIAHKEPHDEQRTLIHERAHCNGWRHPW